MITQWPHRIGIFALQARSLVSTHRLLLRHEMLRKLDVWRKSSAQICVGMGLLLGASVLGFVALILFMIAGIVRTLGWDPLLAGSSVLLVLAVLFWLVSLLMRRGARSGLQQESLLPTQTIQSFTASVHALSNSLSFPNAMTSNPKPSTGDPSAQQFKLGVALAWLPKLLSQDVRSLFCRVSQRALDVPRRHPLLAGGLGLGSIYLLWKTAHRPDPAKVAANYVADKAKGFDGFVSDMQHTAAHCGKDASAAARAVSETFDQTRESFADGFEQLTKAMHDLQHDARKGYQQARKFIKQEPGLALAGGVVLAVGAALLLKSTRK